MATPISALQFYDTWNRQRSRENPLLDMLKLRALQAQRDKADEAHMKRARQNALDELGARDQFRQAELGRRNEAIKSSVEDVAILEDEINNILVADATQREARARAKASADLFAADPELAALRDKLKVSDFVALSKQIPDAKKRSQAISAYQAMVEANLADPKFGMDLATQAKVRALAGEMRQIQEGIGKHVEMGGVLPKRARKPSTAPAAIDLNLPPMAEQPAASKSRLNDEDMSALGGLADQARSILRPAGPSVGALRGLPEVPWPNVPAAVMNQVYGTPAQPPQIGPEPTPEQRAIMENEFLIRQAREGQWVPNGMTPPEFAPIGPPPPPPEPQGSMMDPFLKFLMMGR